DLLGQLGVAGLVFLKRWFLAPLPAGDELFGQLFHRMTRAAGAVHRQVLLRRNFRRVPAGPGSTPSNLRLLASSVLAGALGIYPGTGARCLQAKQDFPEFRALSAPGSDRFGHGGSGPRQALRFPAEAS